MEYKNFEHYKQDALKRAVMSNDEGMKGIQLGTQLATESLEKNKLNLGKSHKKN